MIDDLEYFYREATELKGENKKLLAKNKQLLAKNKQLLATIKDLKDTINNLYHGMFQPTHIADPG